MKVVDGPALALGGLVAVFGVTFVFLTWRQQSNFDTFGFDLGVHDQAIWLASSGHRMFDTVRGLDYFAENVNLISLLFVPFYWLGGGPHLLSVINTVALAAGAVPIWLIVRERTTDGWTALVGVVAYLLYPTVSFLAWWDFHPDSLAILPLLFAWWFATQRRWGWFALSAGLGLACKEDAALALVAMGTAIALGGARRTTGPADRPDSADGPDRVTGPDRAAQPDRAARPDRNRLIGLGTAVFAAAWFEVSTKLVLPANNAGKPPFYSAYFPALGTTPVGVIRAALSHPSRVLRLATLPSRKTYYAQMFAPVGFLFILALPAFVVALPQVAINVADQGEGLSFDSQYGSLIVVGVFLATAEALGRIHRRRPGLLRPACALLLLTSAATASAWGITPIGVTFHDYWSADNPIAPELHHALALVPPDAGVAVSYELTTHVTHRVDAYEFPNPWVNVNWLSTAVIEVPARVSWIVVDNQHDPDPALLAELIAPGGSFHIMYANSGVIAAERFRVGPLDVSPQTGRVVSG